MRRIRHGLLLAAVISLCVISIGAPVASQEGNGQGNQPPGSPAAVSLTPSVPQAPEVAVGTAFTYQGQLKRSGGAYDGTCNFQFGLWNAAGAGAQQGSTLARNNVSVTNGLFSVDLDFGNQFTGEARWLQIAVQCAGDAAFTALSPRVSMTSSPYAIGVMPGAQMSGTLPGTAGILRANNLGAGAALVGLALSSSGTTYGVLGNAFSPLGYAVWGYGANGAIGVQGYSADTGVGTAGYSWGNYGVYGLSSGAKAGVGGFRPGHSEADIAVYNFGTPGGMFGGSNGLIGFTKTNGGNGVSGVSTAANGVGVYGYNFAGGWSVYSYGRMGTKVLEIQGGADLAERFDVGGQPEPGTLVVIDEANPGALTASTQAYDTRVAGIVSGAGGVKPGLTMHQEGVLEGDTAVAVAGRVYVKAEALSAPIKPGDLLTSSDLPGHAMKASDRGRAYGAVIGKALTGLNEGTGLVLVLVNLQ